MKLFRFALAVSALCAVLPTNADEPLPAPPAPGDSTGVIQAWENWQLDYGKPAAQFRQEDLAEKGKPYIGKKITVKGKVTKSADPKPGWIRLGSGIRCDFGKMKAMADSIKVGDEVYVDGFLRHCDKGDILIEPSVLRQSSAPFAPK